MKKYLFGLGAMLFGAGLMFGFIHTEVSAESEGNTPEQFVCSDRTKKDKIGYFSSDFPIFHCEN
jgi:hypothetical protein